MSSLSMNMIWLRFVASSLLPIQFLAALVISPPATMKAEALRERMRGYLSELDEIDSQEAPTSTRRQAVQEVLKQLREQEANGAAGADAARLRKQHASQATSPRLE
jgi:hypothetical protein